MYFGACDSFLHQKVFPCHVREQNFTRTVFLALTVAKQNKAMHCNSCNYRSYYLFVKEAVFTVRQTVTSAYIALLDGRVLKRAAKDNTGKDHRIRGSNISRLAKTTRMILLCLQNIEEAKQVKFSVVLQHH